MMTKTESMTRGKGVRIAEAVFLAGMWILLACLFDYRYAMNDDVFICAIVSGEYSGTPGIHNIQIIILLNMVFALLYRICSLVPWFGIFMVAAQFGALYGIVMGLESKMKFRTAWRNVFLTAVNLLLAGLMLQELVIIQYTYTAALLATSATLRLYCGENGKLPLMQYLLAFCLRTEVFLFLLPFSAAFTVISYHKKNGLRMVGREIKKRILFWGTLLICVLVLYAIDYAGYAGRDWAAYRKMFDYRTQLYDFLELPEYKENRDFYEEAGISNLQYELLKNYNFSLDGDITGDTLEKVVDYANEKRMERYQGAEKLYMKFFTLPLREGIWSYSHRVLFDPEVSGDDYPWNFVCAALYLTMIFLTCLTKRWQNALYLFLLAFVRSGLWMYIILKQRTPPRVTHGLFVMEIVCLLALVLEEMSFLEKNRVLGKSGGLWAGVAAVFVCGAVAVAVNSGASFPKAYRETVEFNKEWQELLDYCGQRKDCFYFMDVYSTVNYSEPVFGETQDRPENHDICGGWLAKSPLCGEKYKKFEFSSPREALIEKDNVFFVAKESSDLEWLLRLYEEQGARAEAEYLDRVAGRFDIIRLHAVSEEIME